jgi:predicted ATP-dependent protease
MAIERLQTHQLYHVAKLENLSSKSTNDLPPIDEIVGQERAQKAVEFAMSIKEKGYNIYAIGRNGLGKRTVVLGYLNRHQHDPDALFDWCYVANFTESRTPKVLKLPLGLGNQLRQDIEKLLEKLVGAIPLPFDNELYIGRAEQLKNQLAAKQQTELEQITNDAKEKSVSLIITPQGDYQFIAMNGDEMHTESTFEALTKEEQTYFGETIDALEVKLRNMVRQLSEWEESYNEKIKKLNDEVTGEVLNHFIKKLKKDYSGYPEIKTHLEDLRKDIIDNVDIFLEESGEQGEISAAALDKKLPRRYKVNVLVSHPKDCFPIVVEENPNYHSLFGYIENATYKGTVFTDFSLIRSGSLHRANGGVLLMDAIKVLERPYV